MKIRIYTQPGINPHEYASSIQKAIQEYMNEPCIVKFSGDPTRPVKVDLGTNK